MHSFDTPYAHNDVKLGNVLLTQSKDQPPLAILMNLEVLDQQGNKFDLAQRLYNCRNGHPSTCSESTTVRITTLLASSGVTNQHWQDGKKMISVVIILAIANINHPSRKILETRLSNLPV